MSKASRSRSTTGSGAPTTEPATTTTTQLRLEVPVSLQARFVRLAQPIAVTFAKPVEHGRPERITGDLLGTMFARGVVHHHRIRVGDVLWLVPPVWLTSASREAITALPRALEPDLASRVRAALDELVREHLA